MNGTHRKRTRFAITFWGWAALASGGCASLKSPFKSELPHGAARVRSLGVQELGQGLFEGAAPPQSAISPLFMRGDNLLLLTMGGSIELRDGHSLAPRWRLPVNIGVSAQPVMVGSSLVVAGMDASVRRLRLSTGEVEWTAKLPAESAGGLTASQGLLFVTADDDTLTALDEKTGHALWTYKRPVREGNVLWSLRGAAVPALSPDGSVIYAGFSDGAFVAIESSSGKTVWERNFDRTGRFRDADVPPVLSTDGSVIYLSVVDADLVALRAKDGSTLWTATGAAATPPFIDADEKALYLSTRDGHVTKYSLEDNQKLWSSDLGKRGMGSKPVGVTDAFVAVTTTRAGVALLNRKTGALEWESDYAIGAIAPPAFDGKRLAVLSSRNRLHLYTVEKRL